MERHLLVNSVKRGIPLCHAALSRCRTTTTTSDHRDKFLRVEINQIKSSMRDRPNARVPTPLCSRYCANQRTRGVAHTWCAARCEQMNSSDTGLRSSVATSTFASPFLARVADVAARPDSSSHGVWLLPLRSSLMVSTRRRSANAITCEDGPVGLDLKPYKCSR